MLKIFVEEAAALASLTLFVGMIAVWAQLFTQLWGEYGDESTCRPRRSKSRLTRAARQAYSTVKTSEEAPNLRGRPLQNGGPTSLG